MKHLHSAFTTRATAAPANPKCHRSHRQTVLTRCLMPLYVLAVLCTAALQAGADTAIYLYVNGTPVNVTATYSFKTGHIYDEGGDQIGTVNGSNQILDASGQVIGYLAVAGT